MSISPEKRKLPELLPSDNKKLKVERRPYHEGGEIGGKKILDEDTYLEALDKIIQRDYFPDLPKLRTQLEWMEALEREDVETLQRITLNSLRRKGAQTPSSLATPSFTPSTPGVKGINPSPSAPSTPGFTGSTPSQHQANFRTIESKENETVNGVPIGVSLDSFQQKYTTEDNASFEIIVEKARERQREKYSYLYALADRANEDKPKALGPSNNDKEPTKMLTQGENSSSELALIPHINDPQQQVAVLLSQNDERSAVPQSWNYVPKNTLMYYPEGTESQYEIMGGKPKEILSKNTRIHSTQQTSTKDATKGQEQVWGMVTSDLDLMNKLRSREDKFDLDNMRNHPLFPTPSPSHMVNGYSLLMTPSPNPNRGDDSPFTTWGEIASSPLVFERPETPFDMLPGPQFKLPETPKRDQVAYQLAEQVGQKKKTLHSSQYPTLPSSPFLSPHARSPSLSPAGQKLANKHYKQHKKSGSDSLRASYSSPSHRTATSPSPFRTTSPSPSFASPTIKVKSRQPVT